MFRWPCDPARAKSSRVTNIAAVARSPARVAAAQGQKWPERLWIDRMTSSGMKQTYPSLSKQRQHVGKFYFFPPRRGAGAGLAAGPTRSSATRTASTANSSSRNALPRHVPAGSTSWPFAFLPGAPRTRSFPRTPRTWRGSPWSQVRDVAGVVKEVLGQHGVRAGRRPRASEASKCSCA